MRSGLPNQSPNMNRYFKRRWEESRGDEFDHWGPSEWYFELNDDGYPVRQVERYDRGQVLKYDANRLYDEYGGLGDQALDLDELKEFEITVEEFETAWQWAALNCREPAAG
jgi:hypothetical protein